MKGLETLHQVEMDQQKLLTDQEKTKAVTEVQQDMTTAHEQALQEQKEI